MTIQLLSRASAISQTSLSLGVPPPADEMAQVARPLIAQCLRRAVFVAAPCASHVARSLAFEALSPLVMDIEGLRDQIEEALHDLIAMGDILEMRADISGRRDVVLRPAPPAFVARGDGSFVLLGVSGDEITPTLNWPTAHLPSGLRCVRPPDRDSARSDLVDLGLIELSERVWLHAPPTLSASDHVASWTTRLPAEPKPEKLDGIEVLATSAAFYKDRWSSQIAKHEGLFVARRPQRYGAKLWCLAELKGGLVQRFIDIHAKDSRTRDCDEAWRLQCAIDAHAGVSQKVAVSLAGDTPTISFSAPLPSWATRRLTFTGEQVAKPGALIAFAVPAHAIDEEVQCLSEKLWLVRTNNGGPE